MHRQVLIFFPRMFLFLAPFVSSQIDSHILSSEITGNIYVHETSFNRQKYPNHSCLNLMYFFFCVLSKFTVFTGCKAFQNFKQTHCFRFM